MDDEDGETETLANSFAEKNVTLTLENNQLKREAESLETATRKLEEELRQTLEMREYELARAQQSEGRLRQALTAAIAKEKEAERKLKRQQELIEQY